MRERERVSTWATGPLPGSTAMEQPQPELISNADLARWLGTDERSARKLPLPGRVRVGRVIRYKRRVIERWLEEGGVEA